MEFQEKQSKNSKNKEVKNLNRDFLREVMDYCQRFDVESEQGGIFDSRFGAINVYTQPWKTLETRNQSQLIGTVWINWSEPSVSIEEQSSEPLTYWIFQYLYGSTEAGHLKNFGFRDDPFWMYKDQLQKAEIELEKKERS